MTFDYFYGQQADLFSFYRVPKILFTDDRFWNVSTDAKLLYGILLDRMNLSAKNGWLDEQGRVYIIFTIEEIQAAFNCGDKKATKLLSELESKCGLIERKRQGLGKPNLIYVKNFVSGSDGFVDILELSKLRIKNRRNHDVIILIIIILILVILILSFLPVIVEWRTMRWDSENNIMSIFVTGWSMKSWYQGILMIGKLWTQSWN